MRWCLVSSLGASQSGQGERLQGQPALGELVANLFLVCCCSDAELRANLGCFGETFRSSFRSSRISTVVQYINDTVIALSKVI